MKPKHMVKLITLGAALAFSGAVSLAPAADEPITITPSDFNLSREKLLEQVATLETMAASSTSTADYARLFRKLQDDLSRAKPPLADWAEVDRSRVKELPEPTEAAWQALKVEEANTQARLDAKAREVQQNFELQAQQQRARIQAQNAQDRIDDLREAQIQESLARRDFYEDAYPAFYYSPWLGGGHGHGHHRPRPRRNENRYYGTKPMLPNNYTPNPIRR